MRRSVSRSSKAVDPFYLSPEWRKLRAQRLAIDRNTCVVPGCGKKAVTVDHIIRRKDGGSDSIANLRSLCRRHDDQIKEGRSGKRGNAGEAWVIGSDAGGRPLDPAHPWNSKA